MHGILWGKHRVHMLSEVRKADDEVAANLDARFPMNSAVANVAAWSV